ncbi:AfsR/SARP family transcriptional regulator [Streptomyces odontomachi]|uniref:AfsR/SARP family transcriptional regulator n=1 Tax=Streptomyces odontomachi TaxID=2944940 RepID=UPI00210BD963|nr:AfsR/SARP family transcriptional regulator [Streptomyces sp. ODS25]
MLHGAKQRTVLATLLLADGRVVSDEQLADRLWDEHPPATASAQIYTYVSRLRKLFGAAATITRVTTGYQMNVDRLACDHIQFDQLAQAGATALAEGHCADASSVLRRALALWRGPALDDATARLIAIEGPRLTEARMTALEARIEADLALGRHRQLTAELTGLVAEHPLRERLRVQLMTALYRCDRQADAVATYHEGRRLLADELGVDPGPELTETYQRLLTGALALPRPGAWAGVIPAMLPRDLAHFVGREAELASIDAGLRLKSPDPIVITGMPGIGKTALAVRAAHAHAAAFPDGHLFAELHTPADQPRRLDEVLGGFLVALGIPQQMLPSGLDLRVQLYRSLLATRRMLVVLDDVETPEQVLPFLPTGDSSALIITSQAPGVAPVGSRVIGLEPLTAHQSRDLLAAVVGQRRLRDEPEATAQIVSDCGGLPLALRIAAARLVSNPGWRVADLARRLRPARHRVEELVSGNLNLQQRLQRGYARLGTAHQSVVRRLGQSGTSSQGGYVAVDVALILDDLAERHLLKAGQQYRMHQLTYLWAQGLGDAEHEAC